jgi:hypothetical protein
VTYRLAPLPTVFTPIEELSMTRSYSYFFAGAVAMLSLMLLSQNADLQRPKYATATEAPAVAPAVVAMPELPSTALDDLAAWPAAALR